MEVVMSVTRNALTGTAGVTERITLPDLSDPYFGVFGGAIVGGGHSRQFQEVVDTSAGVSNSQCNKSKEGLGTGGYDRHFAVYNG